MGIRKIPFERELYIEREDFMEEPPKKYFRLFPGNEVRLMHGYFVTCTVFALETPTKSTNIWIDSGVNPLLLSAAIVTSLGSSQPSTILSSTNFLIYLFPVTTLVRYNFANSICFGGLGYSSSFNTQSYRGLWSSNSNVQVKLIKKGKAYVCDLTAEEIKEYRGTLTEPGKESPYRNRSIDIH